MVKCSVWRDGGFLAIQQESRFPGIFAVHATIGQVSLIAFIRHTSALYIFNLGKSKLIKLGCQKESAMLNIPNAVFDKFIEFLREKGFSVDVLTEYKKWLRYYLDFCDKYSVSGSKSERVRMFAEKLREKKANRETERTRSSRCLTLL